MGTGLQPSGVDLQAKGFREYIRRLDQIEKKQRKVFDQRFKGTGKSYNEITRLAKQYEQQTNRTVRAQQGLNKSIVAAGAAAAVAALGFREFIRFGKESVNLAREQAKAEAQLATTIRSTAGAAGLGSNALRLLASDLQAVTNFGDETVIAAEAMLLSFTNIKSANFERALRAILDVTTAFPEAGLSQVTVQIGKALQDPIKGLSALTRVGINFTEEQKNLIESLVETNRVAEAQNIILAELEKQYGGSAEAARDADEGIEALGNSFGDLKEQIGFLLLDLAKAVDLIGETGGSIDILTGIVKGARFSLGFSDDILDQIAGVDAQINSLKQTRDDLADTGKGIRGGIGGFLEVIGLGGLREGEIDRLNQKIAELETQRKELDFKATAEDTKELEDAFDNAGDDLSNLNDELEENEKLLNATGQAVKRTEQLQLSFARAAEDAARKQTRQEEKLRRTQSKERDRFLVDQIKDLDKFDADALDELANFEKDRAKTVANAEKALQKARDRVAQERIDADKRLRLRLKQQEDRFNLSRLQSGRRFELNDQRLRAEGDILALQELRENRELDKLEAKENFDLQQQQTKDSEKQITNERIKEQEARLQEVKDNLEAERKEIEAGLEEQRLDLLAAQNEQFLDFAAKQQEQRDALKESLAEQAEDRRISQRRQLEDLGGSLQDQQDLTAQGAQAIANEFEIVFGIDGTADAIFKGFSDRTESEFRNLQENIQNIVSRTQIRPRTIGSGFQFGGAGTGGIGVPGFQEGGVVPGPRGSPQLIQAEGGETILPTHKMSAPIIPAQQISVNMTGGFNISGGEQAGGVAVQAALDEMTESFEIAVRRLIRRG